MQSELPQPPAPTACRPRQGPQTQREVTVLFIRDRCYQVKESWGLLAEDSAGLREGTGAQVCLW